MIRKVERDNLNERVYDELQRAIMSGRFPPGTTLTLRGLAATVGTSEMPVRDAIRRLVVERALLTLPNRTVVVPTLSEEAFLEICEIRLQLETLATRRATENLKPKDIQALKKTIRAMANTKTHEQYLKLNQEFHFRIYAASQRPLLYSMIQSIWMQTGPLLNLVDLRAGKTEAKSNHNAVIDALVQGDPDGAAAGIVADIEAAASFICSWMNKQPS